jgi:hypothetical protein
MEAEKEGGGVFFTEIHFSSGEIDSFDASGAKYARFPGFRW